MTRLRAVILAILVVGSVPAGATAVSGAASAEAPAVTVTVDDSSVSEGERHETNDDDQIRVEAAVGEAAGANVTLDEIVVRLNGNLTESWSVSGGTATESVRPEYDQGNNTVRVIVTDSTGAVNATRFTVYHDSHRPRVGLSDPYPTQTWSGIDDGDITGTNQTFAGRITDDSDIERVVLAHSFGDEGETLVDTDVDGRFSIPRELGYTTADNRTNRFRLDAIDEYGNSRAYYFSVDVTDGADPSVSTEPLPDETARNRVFVAGSVSDDVWVRSVNVTVEPQNGNESDTDTVMAPRSYEYDPSGDGRTVTFNETVHLLYSGTYDITVAVTDAAGNTTTEEFTVDRVSKEAIDQRPTVAIDEDRTVLIGNETLFLSGSSFEGMTNRLVVETRTPDGDTVDYQVIHTGGAQDRVDFDRQVTVADGRTEVIVRATDPDGNEVTERFYVDGSTRETFVDRDDGADEDEPPDLPIVSVTHLQDERAGTASSSVTVRRAPAGTVGLPSAGGPEHVAATDNVTLSGMDLSVARETNLTGTVVVRDGAAGDLRGPDGARPAATVSIQHAVPDDQVDGLTLVMAVNRSSLEARGLDPVNLTVYRSADGWTELDTTLVEDGDQRVRYRVESPGLSVFSLAEPGTTPGDETVDGNETDTGNETDAGNVSDGNVTDGNVTDGNVTDGNVTDGNVTDGNETVGGNVTDGNETANETAEPGDSGDPQIFVTNLSVNRTAVQVNESVTVNATLRNSGDASGTYVASLQDIQGLNRTALGSQTVEVAPGEEETVQFRAAFAEPGNHTVAVNGTQAGPVVVEEGGGLLSVFSFIPLRLIGLILGALVGLLVVLTLVRFVLRRVGSGGEASG